MWQENKKIMEIKNFKFSFFELKMIFFFFFQTSNPGNYDLLGWNKSIKKQISPAIPFINP